MQNEEQNHKKYDHMPHTKECLNEVYEQCLNEWLSTKDGNRYKRQYDQLKMQKESLEAEIDQHVCHHIKEKYGT